MGIADRSRRMRALHQNCLHQMLLLRGVMMMLLMMRMTTLTMIVWSWDDGKAWVPVCPRREAVDALSPLLLLTHYLISLHSVAARCVLLVLRVLFPFRCCCRTFLFIFLFISFPGLGGHMLVTMIRILLLELFVVFVHIC